WDRKLAYKDKWFGSADDYAKLFEKEFKYPAPYQAAESTATVLVFADAFARAGSLDPEKVRDAIASTDMMTFFGPIKFDSTGKNVVKPMVLYQVLGGDYKVVAPTKWAETKLVWPRKHPSAVRGPAGRGGALCRRLAALSSGDLPGGGQGSVHLHPRHLRPEHPAAAAREYPLRRRRADSGVGIRNALSLRGGGDRV